MRRAALAFALLVPGGLALLPGIVEAGHVCDPYPIGRCGDFQRENVVFCYLPNKPAGVYIDATERVNILSAGSAGVLVPGVGNIPTDFLGPVAPLLPINPFGSDQSVEVPNAGVQVTARVYVNMTPLLRFSADPLNAPLPTKSVYRETNGSPGLQIVSHRCAVFQWWAECEPAQWMHFSPSALRVPDQRLA